MHLPDASLRHLGRHDRPFRGRPGILAGCDVSKIPMSGHAGCRRWRAFGDVGLNPDTVEDQMSGGGPFNEIEDAHPFGGYDKLVNIGVENAERRRKESMPCVFEHSELAIVRIVYGGGYAPTAIKHPIGVRP